MRKKLIVVLVIAIIMLGGCIDKSSVTYNYELDSDMDGLPDILEVQIKTDINNVDSDGDGLSDYYEHSKYFTNPLDKDSDHDGLEDSEWEERKEYTYSITATLELRPPFDIEHMNDFWQDARLVEEMGDDVTRVEVVLYPEAQEIINPEKYKYIENDNTKPTYTKNYSDKMKSKILKNIRGIDSEVEVVKVLLDKVYDSEYRGIGEELGTDTDLPLQFSIKFDGKNNIDYDSIPTSSMYTKDELLDKVFFADSMFLNKQRGACSSTATLRGAIMRSAGIQEKTIFTIPLIFSGFDDDVQFNVKSKYNKGFFGENLVADHFYNEVLIGGQWIRVDDDIVGAGYYVNENPYIKILEFDETTNYEFYKYWNYDTYGDKRPYKYISVIEQERKYNSYDS